MAFSDIAIRIGADFVGLPAFKKADTSVDKLYKTSKKLAASLGIAFSADRVISFGASAVREFASAEREAQTLLATMQSLNLAFAAPQLGQFLDDLERLSGIDRGELQPAFQKLITQTGSYTKAQEILNTAVKVSFSGLMDVGTAANALTQAYVGNTKGLRQFNLGLTTAELSLMSFDQILAKVSDTYDGQFSAALDSTQVKLNKINIAAKNAKESIGGGLVKAFGDLAGNGDLDAANSKLERFGDTLGRIIGNLFNPVKVGDFFLPIPNLLAKDKQTSNIGSPAAWRKQNEAINKAAAAAAAKAKKLEDAKLATLRKQTAEKKAQAALDKANALIAAAKEKFDLEGIQIQAALMNKTLTSEETRRLEILKATWELEQAIAQGDEARIASATKLLEKLLSQFNTLAQSKAVTDALAKIFDLIGLDRKLIDLMNLQEALALLTQMSKITFATVSGGTQLASQKLTGFTPSQIVDYALANGAVNKDMPVYYEGLSGATGTDPYGATARDSDIYITAIVEGNVMTQNDLAEAIRQQIQDAQQSGKPVNWARQALPATFL